MFRSDHGMHRVEGRKVRVLQLGLWIGFYFVASRSRDLVVSHPSMPQRFLRGAYDRSKRSGCKASMASLALYPNMGQSKFYFQRISTDVQVANVSIVMHSDLPRPYAARVRGRVR